MPSEELKYLCILNDGFFTSNQKIRIILRKKQGDEYPSVLVHIIQEFGYPFVYNVITSLVSEHQKVIKHDYTSNRVFCLFCEVLKKRENVHCLTCIALQSWRNTVIFLTTDLLFHQFLVIFLNQEQFHSYFWMTGEIKGYL